jgi:hypothetical protein
MAVAAGSLSLHPASDAGHDGNRSSNIAATVRSRTQAALKQAIQGLADGVSIQDDFTILGTVQEAMKVFDYIAQHARTELGLELRVDKCEVYTPPEAWQDATSAQLEQLDSACGQRKLKIAKRHHWECCMNRIQQFCAAAVDDSQFFFDALEHPEMPVQSAALLLPYYQLPKLGYLARTMHPDQLKAAAIRFDKRAVECWKKIHGITNADFNALSSEEECESATCTREQLLARVFLSVAIGRMGLRSVSEIMYQACFASATEALPELLRFRTELQATKETELARIATSAS